MEAGGRVWWVKRLSVDRGDDVAAGPVDDHEAVVSRVYAGVH